MNSPLTYEQFVDFVDNFEKYADPWKSMVDLSSRSVMVQQLSSVPMEEMKASAYKRLKQEHPTPYLFKRFLVKRLLETQYKVLQCNPGTVLSVNKGPLGYSTTVFASDIVKAREQITYLETKYAHFLKS